MYNSIFICSNVCLCVCVCVCVCRERQSKGEREEQRCLCLVSFLAMESLQTKASLWSGVSQEDAFSIDEVNLYTKLGHETFVKLSTEFYNRYCLSPSLPLPICVFMCLCAYVCVYIHTHKYIVTKSSVQLVRIDRILVFFQSLPKGRLFHLHYLSISCLNEGSSSPFFSNVECFVIYRGKAFCNNY